jgi:hypothetical protein
VHALKVCARVRVRRGTVEETGTIRSMDSERSMAVVALDSGEETYESFIRLRCEQPSVIPETAPLWARGK